MVEVIISAVAFGVILVAFILGLTVFAPKKTIRQKYQKQVFTFYTDREIALDRTKKDVFAIDFRLKEKRPFVVVVPGGGYEVVCHEGEGAPIAKKLNELGYSAFVLNYRVAKHASAPAPQDDLGHLVRFILDHSDELNVIPEDYAIVGFSAGGHLAASFGLKEIGYQVYGVKAPKTLMLAYPVITMRNDAHRGSADNLIGENPTEELLAKYSIDENIDAGYPASYIWRREADSVVPGAGADRLDKALTENGVKHIYKIYPGNRHGGGLAIGLEMEGWMESAVAFWQSK